MPARPATAKVPNLRLETNQDAEAIDRLLASAFGTARYKRSVRHLRLCPPEPSLCFVHQDADEIIGSIRYWPVMVGSKRQLLLGPLAVNPAFKGKGYGLALVSHSLSVAAALEYDYVLISGEPDYYPRFGFVPVPEGAFLWPGFLEKERFQIKRLGKAPMPGKGQQVAILPIV